MEMAGWIAKRVNSFNLSFIFIFVLLCSDEISLEKSLISHVKWEARSYIYIARSKFPARSILPMIEHSKC